MTENSENRKFWNDLYSNNYEEYKEKYLDFMYNKDNRMKCNSCPENRGIHNVDSIGGCGQQNCWVTCHCRQIGVI